MFLKKKLFFIFMACPFFIFLFSLGLTKEMAKQTQPKAARIYDISGKWRGSNNINYTITQQRNKFTWKASPTMGTGSGVIQGVNLSVSWSLGPLKGTATGKITQFDESGRPIRIEWSNGIIFTRLAEAEPKVAAPKIPIPIPTPKKEEPEKVQPKVPIPIPKLPETLYIGNFVLTVETYSQGGTWNPATKTWTDVSGTGWIDFKCASGEISAFVPRLGKVISQTYIVVSAVSNPDKEISLAEARLIKPGIRIGESLTLDLQAEDETREAILLAKSKYINNFLSKSLLKKGDALLEFLNVTISQLPTPPNTGRIIQGQAVYPASSGALPEIVVLALDGFQVRLDSLTLTPDSSLAHLILQLPSSLGKVEDCGPALLDLGQTSISSDCQFYVNSSDSFGQWIVGDTGLVVEGKGFVADFSNTQSPAGKVPAWKGLFLQSGQASGELFIPVNSNTGYLAANYRFSGATIISQGFEGTLTLAGNATFNPIHPQGYTVSATSGRIILAESQIQSGELQKGEIIAPLTAVSLNRLGIGFYVNFGSLSIDRNLNLSGKVIFRDKSSLIWGELTHAGEEKLVWRASLDSRASGYFYLPSGPQPTFSPDKGVEFLRFNCSGSDESVLNEIKAQNMAGLTICSIGLLELYTFDERRGGPITLPLTTPNWLNISSLGVNGSLSIFFRSPMNVQVGNPERQGYMGRQPFVISLKSRQEKRYHFLFADSAVYDSELNGSAAIPEPCGIPDLEFKDLEVTSAGDFVGGQIQLPPTGEQLSYWKLKLASTLETGEAGTMSIRTGRILFTAARISEEHHFDHAFGLNSMIPFKLTWGEMRADGNFGELFLDPNVYGQRFDGLPFVAKNFVLSRYQPGRTDGYFDVCGTIHFNFFGSAYVNIRDSRYDRSLFPPYNGRFVTVVTTGEASPEPTNLHLQGEWENGIAIFNFPNDTMAYNETLQWGFKGRGTGEIDLIHSEPLDATIETHGEIIDICLSSRSTHDLILPSYVHTLCGLKELYGCVRIEGPLLQRIVLGGYLESSVSSGEGILSPKAGSYVESIISMTPTATTFFAAGDILLYVAASSLDLYGQVYLNIDRETNSAEGEVIGKLDAESIVGGLSGEGQLTWLLSPSVWYLQGRTKIAVCGWTGGVGLEGGFFVGSNVPKEKAWVLYSGSEQFGINERILPANLTGVYGYGQISFNTMFWYIFSGGIEIYAGMGAFSEVAPGSSPSFERRETGLPYILGSGGIHVHGEILGGLVSAAAWADLDLRGPIPLYMSGTVGLEGCVLWFLCASIELTAGISPTEGFFIE